MIGHLVGEGAEEPLAQAPFVRRSDDDEIVVGRGLDDGIADVGVDYGGDFSSLKYLQLSYKQRRKLAAKTLAGMNT